MSVIIRLQNLPWTANALDIRRFFSGLSIPDGGVHIVGGDKGDAFIAFSSDEDARRAMLMDGGRIGTNALKLFLSSKTEMQNVIAVARGNPPPSGSSGGGGSGQNQPPMNSQNMAPQSQHQYPPQMQQQGPNMQNYGQLSQGLQGYSPSGQMIPQQNMPPRGSVMMDQRVITQDVPPQYNNPPQVSQVDRAPWDNRAPDPRDRGDFGGPRDMGPGGYDRPGFNGSGPMDGGRMMNEPMNEFRDSRPREDFRGPSPRRDRFSPPRERFVVDESRDRPRKRPFEDELCVHVFNMPVPLNYRDVRTFFTGMEIPRTGLKLINDRSGQRIGEAFVMFSVEEAAKQALRMDGWMVKGNRVRIEPCTVEEFDRVIDSYVPGRPAGGQVDRPMDRPMPNKRIRSRSPPKRADSLNIVVKNLPFSATKRDVFKLFTGVRFSKGDTSVHFEINKDGRPAGIALIELFSDRDLRKALNMHRQCDLNGRVLDIFAIPKEEFATRVERSQKNDPEGSKANPPKRAEKDEKIEKKPSERSPDRKPESRVQKDDGKTKNGKADMKTREVVSKDGAKFYCVKLHGVPFDCDKSMIEGFFSGLKIAHKGIRLLYDGNSRAFHTCFVEFVSSEDCKKAVAKDKEFIGQRYINVSTVSKKQMLDEHHANMDKLNSRNAPPPGSTSVANQVGRAGCVVGIQNLHFNATLEDILHFFRGFAPIASSVKMRYNQEGRPMGDAMLAFNVREDANRAVREMDGRQLMGRSVRLAIM